MGDPAHHLLLAEHHAGLAETEAVIKGVGAGVFRVDAEIDVAAFGDAGHMFQQGGKRLDTVALALVAGVDHQAVDPVVAVIRIERIHGEADGGAFDHHGKADAFGAFGEFFQRLLVAGDEIHLAFMHVQFSDGVGIDGIDG
ncbi:hypothetical protein N183_22640 [Sinorhizobium sp. Sb3]|uniref:hypothetical protein n=1 Tax=Sinorhizobium sp. Sb3 TaxID=1358417 RepID=UPI00071D29B5|nr:hypothetical protein [Sinorhizobium sp. Sb3]KSV75137.1 hypothetical protein N183_22640 [Sinorhizobium sp. Sb3]